MSNNKSIVSFDLDDVVVGFCDTLIAGLNGLTGKTVSRDHIDDYFSLHSHYALDAYPHDFLIEKKILERCPVNPYAVEAFDAARAMGHKIIIITARAWHPRGYDVTADWLTRHGLSFDHLHLVDPHVGKRAVFDQYENIAWHIDDVPHYIEDAHQHPNVARAAIMNQPWNRQVADNGRDLHRVHCLSDFTQLLNNPYRSA